VHRGDAGDSASNLLQKKKNKTIDLLKIHSLSEKFGL
jgi:hypothetical protein